MNEPIGDYYWESEYFYGSQPANFRCSFLIHFEPATANSTKVEIFEYEPTIWVGDYLGLSAHAILPTVLHDIRSAESSARLTNVKSADGHSVGYRTAPEPLASLLVSGRFRARRWNKCRLLRVPIAKYAVRMEARTPMSQSDIFIR